MGTVNYTPLTTAWAALPTTLTTTAEKLNAISTMTAPGPVVDVKVSDVIAYLALNGKLLTLEAYANAPPTGANTTAVAGAKMFTQLALNQMPIQTFRMSTPLTDNALTVMLNAMAADANTGLTATDATNILALAQTTIPWWKANGFPAPISVMDLEACNLIPLGTYGSAV